MCGVKDHARSYTIHTRPECWCMILHHIAIFDHMTRHFLQKLEVTYFVWSLENFCFQKRMESYDDGKTFCLEEKSSPMLAKCVGLVAAATVLEKLKTFSVT